MAANPHLLQLQGITKSFGAFCANDHIDLVVNAGEVHAVLGENGAGKSTLMNIIYGLYRPDAGQILIKGRPARIASPKDALKYHIGMVHQHFVLVDSLSCVDNICLLDPSPFLTRRNKLKIRQKIEQLQQRYGIDVDIDSPVEQLSIGMQQKVEILKLLYTGSELLIFDEPTAVLITQESENLLRILRNLAAEGKGILFISHKIEEVLKVSDNITVLSRGRVVGNAPTEKADKHSIVQMMVGDGEYDFDASAIVKQQPQSDVCLAAEDLHARDERGVQTLNGVSLSIHAGEIVGLAGVEGNGQIELAEVLAGSRPAQEGRVLADGAELACGHTHSFIHSHIGYVPADRHKEGTVPALPLYENWMLRAEHLPTKAGLLDYASIQNDTRRAMQAFDVRARGIDERSANLSGGNLQKLIMARELSKRPRVLICAYPTRGLDIRSTFFIRNEIIQAKNGGTGVLLISSDFEELFALADRILVLYHGRVVGEVKPNETTVQQVGRMMMGVTDHAENF